MESLSESLIYNLIVSPKVLFMVFLHLAIRVRINQECPQLVWPQFMRQSGQVYGLPNAPHLFPGKANCDVTSPYTVTYKNVNLLFP